MSTIPFTALRDSLRDVIDEVEGTGSEYVVTRHGRPVAVVLSYDEYESLVETLNILSDDETMDAVSEGLADLGESRTSD